MANYYYLMAGLPDIQLSDAKPARSIAEMKEECEQVLTPKDKKILYFFYLKWDCRNIVRLLKNPEAELDLLGNLTPDQYQDLLTSARELNFNVHRYPAFMSEFVRNYAFNSEKKGYFAEDAMMYEYLQYVIKNCPNRMMKEWCRLTMDINNILTAMIARKYGWNVGDFIQGDNAVTELIRTNSTKDFDLSLQYDYVKELMQIVDEPDPVRKEKRIDAFKWVWLDDQTFFEPFSIEALLAYLCKLEMLYRWEKLDPENGKEAFRQIINDLRGEARVPEEFIQNNIQMTSNK